MENVVKKVLSEEDKAVVKALKVVYWLAEKDLPLSKYESLINLLKELELGLPKLSALKVSERVGYDSYYSANEMLKAINDGNR